MLARCQLQPRTSRTAALARRSAASPRRPAWPCSISTRAVGDRVRRTRGSAPTAAPRRRARASPATAFAMPATMFGAMPSDGSSSSTTRGLRRERARDGEHLLFAAAHRAGRPVEHRRRGSGNSAQQVGARSKPPAVGRATSRRFSRTRQVGEDAPILGHVAEPAPRAGVRRQRATSWPSSSTVAARARPGPSPLAAATSCRRRCGRRARRPRRPRRPGSTSNSTCASAVERREAPQLQRGARRLPGAARRPRGSERLRSGGAALTRRPRDRRAAPSGSARTASGTPSATSRPRDSTSTRRAKPNTTSMLCSVNSTAIVARRREFDAPGASAPCARPAPCRRSARPSAAAAARCASASASSSRFRSP